MRSYRINSPSGRIVTVWAETLAHAVNLAMAAEGYVYQQKQYFDLN